MIIKEEIDKISLCIKNNQWVIWWDKRFHKLYFTLKSISFSEKDNYVCINGKFDEQVYVKSSATSINDFNTIENIS